MEQQRTEWPYGPAANGAWKGSRWCIALLALYVFVYKDDEYTGGMVSKALLWAQEGLEIGKNDCWLP